LHRHASLPRRQAGSQRRTLLNFIFLLIENWSANGHSISLINTWQSIPIRLILLKTQKIMVRGGYVYILTNKNNTVLYTGVTSEIKTRVYQHKTGYYKGSFTSRYNVNKLVYYEDFLFIEEAIAREKQIKAGSRMKKIELIMSLNPEWRDLYNELPDYD